MTSTSIITNFDSLTDKVEITNDIASNEVEDAESTLENELIRIARARPLERRTEVGMRMFFGQDSNDPSLCITEIAREIGRTREAVRILSRKFARIYWLRTEAFPILDRLRRMIERRKAVSIRLLEEMFHVRSGEINWKAVAHLLNLRCYLSPIPVLARSDVSLESLHRATRKYELTCVGQIPADIATSALNGQIELFEYEGKFWVIPIRHFCTIERWFIRALAASQHKQVRISTTRNEMRTERQQALCIPYDVLRTALERCQLHEAVLKCGRTVRPYRVVGDFIVEAFEGALREWRNQKDERLLSWVGPNRKVRIRNIVHQMNTSHLAARNKMRSPAFSMEGGYLRPVDGDVSMADLIDVSKLPPVEIIRLDGTAAPTGTKLQRAA